MMLSDAVALFVTFLLFVLTIWVYHLLTRANRRPPPPTVDTTANKPPINDTPRTTDHYARINRT